jgi:hypothetical protein
MEGRMVKIYLFVFLLACSILHSQTYPMQDGSFTTCSGTFYDSGGSGASYSQNESHQITFCPSTPGKYIQLNFTAFDVEGAPFDVMTVYEGSGTGGTIIGQYGGLVSPVTGCGSGTITSSDPSGCLTITFFSDSTTEYTGWTASISCISLPGGGPPAGPPNAVCSGADPFCANAGTLEFPNIDNADCVPDAPAAIPANTCLGSAPNPAWYYLEIDNSGDLVLEIKQTTGPGGTGAGLDVDYAIWGPYPSTSSACSNFTLGNVVSCSYSTAAIEIANIPGAVTGQIYMVLITNFNGSAGYITVTQTNAAASGAGSTDCSIVCPAATGTNPACGASNGSITIAGLDPSNSYDITYSDDGMPVAVTLTSNAAGQVVITGLNGGSYTNILTNFPGCDAAPSNVTLNSSVAPVFTSVTGTTPICSGNNAVFTLNGTANTIVSYTINSGPVQTVTLSGAGTATVTVNSVVSNTTLNVTQISTGASGCTIPVSASQVITVRTVPTANINYAASPFCTATAGTSPVELTGTGIFSGGTYTASPAGLVVNASSGAIFMSGSTPGNYLVTYTIPATGGCPVVTATTNLIITVKPTATITYPASSYCTSAPPQSVAVTGTGAFSAGTYSASPAGLDIDTRKLYSDLFHPGIGRLLNCLGNVIGNHRRLCDGGDQLYRPDILHQPRTANRDVNGYRCLFRRNIFIIAGGTDDKCYFGQRYAFEQFTRKLYDHIHIVCQRKLSANIDHHDANHHRQSDCFFDLRLRLILHQCRCPESRACWDRNLHRRDILRSTGGT